MSEESLRTKVKEGLELIKYSTRAMNEAPDRSTQFLIMVALLTDERRSCEEDKSKLDTLVAASYAQAMGRSVLKGVTEKKIEAEQDTSYTDIREAQENCAAKMTWIKTYIEIFNNAHITYRQFSKE